jgi:hypothetical protein
MWYHQRFGSRPFKGSYQWMKHRSGEKERHFVLTHGKRNISFESHQAASLQGWSKTPPRAPRGQVIGFLVRGRPR